ncbi:hypothetical protein [Sphingomicrobium flavum]|uniref:hypothetical protein n=1 Tax=Sphingomicrobium flavum TaxID=1229164 RepID=UPI0021AD9176|nr:hypothetical protein [Sphingomicrobium flavum]
MSVSDLTRTIEQASAGIDRAIVVAGKTDMVTRRADRIFDRLDDNRAATAQRKRQQQRTVGDIGGRLARIGLAVGAVSLAAIAIGIFIPIGMFGFLAAVGIAIGLAALMAFWPSREVRLDNVSDDISNAALVSRFDTYLYRTRGSLPAPAKAEVDRMSAQLNDLKAALERVEQLDPDAVEARRLMSKHIPGLIERYSHVPEGYRDSIDGEGMSVDERLTDGLAAGRKALDELGEKLARRDIAGLETHGRFIKSRYSDDEGLG